MTAPSATPGPSLADDAEETSDPELISRVRDGDVDAYGLLFARHRDAATRLARMLAGPTDGDDLVADAFAKVLNVLRGGGGPDVAFRAYLLTAVRRLHVDRFRSNQRTTTTGDLTPFDAGVPFDDTVVAGFEGGAAAKAFASLPERWQLVLWHLEVENQKPADIAPMLGISANSVSALAYRAREGLRQAFLTMHASDVVEDGCQETNDLLGGYVRGALSRRDTAKVDDHLEHCRRCTAVYLELTDVNSSLAAILGPAVLGAAAAGYLGGGAGAGGLGLVALLGRAKDLVASNAAATTAGATVVGVAAAAAIVVAQHGGPSERSTAAEPPARPVPSLAVPEAHQQREARRPGKSGLSDHDASNSSADDAPGPNAPGAEPAGPNAAGSTGDEAPGHDGTPGQPGGSASAPGHSPGSAPPGAGPDSASPPPEPPASTDPSGPSGRTLDLHLSAMPAAPADGRVRITVIALGLPSGARGTLTATATTGSFRQLAGPACSRIPHGYRCPVDGLRVLFVFDNNASSHPTMTFRVTPASGWSDSNQDDNLVRVRLP